MSCKDEQLFPIREICTHLGVDGGICTDKRLNLEKDDKPPVGCVAIGKHSYDCPNPDRFLTYQCTETRNYVDYRNICEDTAVKLRACERKLRRCN